MNLTQPNTRTIKTTITLKLYIKFISVIGIISYHTRCASSEMHAQRIFVKGPRDLNARYILRQMHRFISLLILMSIFPADDALVDDLEAETLSRIYIHITQ